MRHPRGRAAVKGEGARQSRPLRLPPCAPPLALPSPKSSQLRRTSPRFSPSPSILDETLDVALTQLRARFEDGSAGPAK